MQLDAESWSVLLTEMKRLDELPSDSQEWIERERFMKECEAVYRKAKDDQSRAKEPTR